MVVDKVSITGGSILNDGAPPALKGLSKGEYHGKTITTMWHQHLRSTSLISRIWENQQKWLPIYNTYMGHQPPTNHSMLPSWLPTVTNGYYNGY